MNTRVAKMDNWRTPPEIFEKLNTEFGFDLDAAATAQNALCMHYLDNALEVEDWPGNQIWLNPPYGKMIAPFMRKAAQEAAKGKTVVALVPLRTRAAWFHDSVIGKAREVRCVRKRIKFIHPDGHRPKFTGSCDSMIIVWDGIYPETKVTSWEQP
jgi:site-specific DNA-methyltransferase (adenine-specific)